MKTILKITTVLVLFFGSFAFGQTNDTSLNNFLQSGEYATLKKNFGITDSNFDLKTYYHENIEGKVDYYRIQVNSNNKINFVTIFNVIGSKSFEVMFEKNNLTGDKGYFENYDINGNFIADFIVTKEGGNYRFKINDVGTSPRLNINTAKSAGCFVNTYHQIKDACEKDNGCDFLCDLVPSCHTQMMIVAAAHCMIH